jgi:TfoX/Sxy family transcriptional regulator of competence genes
MAYSESLAERVRSSVSGTRGMTEKKMFGGVGFLLHGNLCVCVWKSLLIVRLEPDQAAAALKQPDVREFDVTGRPMKGWIMVEPDGLETDEQLRGWIDQAREFVVTLPKK